MGRLHKYCPFIASIEASEASKLAKLMNANPFEFPVSGSRIICNAVKTNTYRHYKITNIMASTEQEDNKNISVSHINTESFHSYHTTYLRCLQNNTKCRKCVIKKFFINLWIQVSNENVGANIEILLMS